MGYIKCIGKQSMRHILAICLIVSLLFAEGINVNAAEEYMEFELYVVSEEAPQAFVGKFAMADGKLYISEETLLKLGDVNTAIVIDVEDVAYTLERDALITEFSWDELLDTEDTVYFPFVKALGEMCLRASFSEQDRVLVVEQRANLLELVPLMKDIYADNAYNMSYWQNQEFFYGFSYSAAVATDIVKNFSFVSYCTQTTQKEQYQEAFWSILLPTKEEDVIFLEETNEMIGMLSKYKSIADDASEVLTGDSDSGFFGDYGKAIGCLGKITDYMQTEELLEVYTYLNSMGDMEESYVTGLELILSAPTSSMNSTMKERGEYVISLYREQTPTWEAALTALIEGVEKDLETEGVDKVMEIAFGKGKILGTVCDITNLAIDSLMGTQEQVDATILAHHCLEIQKNCGNYYYYHRRNLSSQNWEELVGELQKLHDVTAVYLRSGVAAYRAIAIDDELRYAADIAIGRINEDLEKLAEYQTEDFLVVEDTKIAAEQITKLAKELPEEERMGLIVEIPTEIIVRVNWDALGLDGNLMEIELGVNGKLEDGNPVYIDGTESLIYAEDGSLIAEYERNLEKTEGEIILTLYRTDGTYNIQLCDGKDWVLYFTNCIFDSNAKVTILLPDKTEELLVSQENIQTKYRSYTGMWFWGIGLDQGELTDYEVDYVE